MQVLRSSCLFDRDFTKHISYFFRLTDFFFKAKTEKALHNHLVDDLKIFVFLFYIMGS